MNKMRKSIALVAALLIIGMFSATALAAPNWGQLLNGSGSLQSMLTNRSSCAQNGSSCNSQTSLDALLKALGRQTSCNAVKSATANNCGDCKYNCNSCTNSCASNDCASCLKNGTCANSCGNACSNASNSCGSSAKAASGLQSARRSYRFR